MTNAETPNFQSIISALLDTDDDAELIADQALALILEHPDRKTILFPLVRNEIWRHLRNNTRAIEREAFDDHSYGDEGSETVKTSSAFRPRSNAPAIETSSQRSALLGERVYVPSKGLVLWGEATVEDHEERIQYLMAKVNGTLATVRRHELAIEVIENAGVDSLGEIEDFSPDMLEDGE